MKVYYECGACFLRQSKDAMDLATDDDALKLELMEEILDFLAKNFNEDKREN